MSSQYRIPFNDLARLHEELGSQIVDALRKVLTTSRFIGGPQVSQFEEAFAVSSGRLYCVALSSGTAALELGLKAIGVESRDIVLTTANSFFATTAAILHAGASPRFIDISEATFNIDVDALERYIDEGCVHTAQGLIETASGRRVAAVIPVHLYGLMADMDRIRLICARYGLQLLEDACQAHASARKGTSGSWSQPGEGTAGAAYSFYPGKNLGALGDAGAFVTDVLANAQTIKLMRDHGQDERYRHVQIGTNARMDAIQASILHLKLEHLGSWTEARREVASWYREEVGLDARIRLPAEGPDEYHSYHQFVVRVKRRDFVRERLSDSGIECLVHYPIAIHQQPALGDNAKQTPLPVTERVVDEILSLPMHPHLCREDVRTVARELRAAVSTSFEELEGDRDE